MTPTTAATRRYLRRAGLALAAYAATTAGALAWAPRPRAVAILAALVPAAAVVAAVVATARFFAEEADPLQRAIQREALLWAVGVTFGIATAWGVLQPLAGAPIVPSYLAFAVFSSVVVSVQLSRRLFPRRARPDAP